MISMNKKYKTCDGLTVRLLCTDAPGPYPVRGLIEDKDITYSWTLDGNIDLDEPNHPWDLIEVPNTVTKTFYRRKWFLHNSHGFIADDYRYLQSKEAFDDEYGVKDSTGTWSDEWETITVEVPV